MKHVDGKLEAWLGGELTPAAARQVEQHLAVCAECRAEAEVLQGVWQALADAAPRPAGHSVWPAVQARTTAAPGQDWFFGRTPLRRASLAALALVAGLLAGSLVPGGDTAVADEVDAAAPWVSGARWIGGTDGGLDDLWLAAGETADDPAGEATP